MSRFRLGAKVRKNEDFRAMTRWLDAAGLSWEVVKPNHKGHPALRITLPSGATVDNYISCTPMGGVNAEARVARLKRMLREKGFTSG